MVKSRYLCSAPRPETWDERAEALLKSLGGSATQQETMLRETLDSLKVMQYVCCVFCLSCLVACAPLIEYPF